MEDIIINGVSVNDLKAKREAMRQGASKVIAENLSQALAEFEVLKEVESRQDAETSAQKIYDALTTVEIVSGVSGVSFMLPFYEEYGRYESDEIISMFLENTENENLEYSWQDKGDILYKLASLAESMESDSRDWHSSRC